jgi:hypothetical protein
MSRWARRLAADLFPGTTSPLAWTLLRRPVEDALRQAYLELGAPALCPGPLWQIQAGGQVFVNAPALAEADAALRGAAWLGAAQPESSAGLLARLQAGAAIRRTQARIAAAAGEVNGLRAELARWLGWVRGQRWAQADLLQVMEELEPRATRALKLYFILRAALPVAGRTAPESACGAARLLSADAARRIHAVAGLPPDDPARLATLVEHGHRGPREVRPDAQRWGSSPALLAQLAARATGLPTDRAASDAGSMRAVGAETRNWLALLEAADAAWDAVVMALAAAQHWSVAAATEARTAGLIAGPDDVVFLELEELKQVATGEWHGGRQAETEAAVAERRRLHDASPVFDIPAPGEPWPADSGAAPFWLGDPVATVTGEDPWSPGILLARHLGVRVMV